MEAEDSVHNVVEWERKKKNNGEPTFLQLIGGPQPLSHNSYSFICHYLGVPEETTDITAAVRNQSDEPAIFSAASL